MAIIYLTLIYLLPSLIAMVRRSKYIPEIFAVNLMLGWTGIGWIFALIAAIADKIDLDE